MFMDHNGGDDVNEDDVIDHKGDDSDNGVHEGDDHNGDDGDNGDHGNDDGDDGDRDDDDEDCWKAHRQGVIQPPLPHFQL